MSYQRIRNTNLTLRRFPNGDEHPAWTRQLHLEIWPIANVRT